MYKRASSLIRLTVVTVLVSTSLVTCDASARDHSAEYVVGVFSSTGKLSDGGYIYCGGDSCESYSAKHNIHYVRTPTGMFAIEAPISVGKTLLLGAVVGPLAPNIHQQWFMDQLHEGDKLLFASKCNKHNNCIFWLPNPDKAGKEYVSTGYYQPDVAKTNTQTLCGKGKLAPDVEAQVCPASAAQAPPAQTGKS